MGSFIWGGLPRMAGQTYLYSPGALRRAGTTRPTCVFLGCCSSYCPMVVPALADDCCGVSGGCQSGISQGTSETDLPGSPSLSFPALSHQNYAQGLDCCWEDIYLPYLRSIPDPQFWVRYGIKILQDILVARRLLSLEELRTKFHLPRWMTFRYFQLCHAVRTPFFLLS